MDSGEKNFGILDSDTAYVQARGMRSVIGEWSLSPFTPGGQVKSLSAPCFGGG